MPITNYTDTIDGQPLYEGQVAFTEQPVIRTGINADSAIVPFGRAVARTNTGDKDLLLPVDANSILAGIAFAADDFEKRAGYSLNADNDMGYPLKYEISYLVRGVIGVKVTTAVTPLSPVFWIHTPDAGERKGQFRADANTNKAVQVTAARFLRSGAAGSVIPLSLNLA
jgi:hypothetical protein